jgi:hypothetical protein
LASLTLLSGCAFVQENEGVLKDCLLAVLAVFTTWLGGFSFIRL